MYYIINLWNNRTITRIITADYTLEDRILNYVTMSSNVTHAPIDS